MSSASCTDDQTTVTYAIERITGLISGIIEQHPDACRDFDSRINRIRSAMTGEAPNWPLLANLLEQLEREVTAYNPSTDREKRI